MKKKKQFLLLFALGNLIIIQEFILIYFTYNLLVASEIMKDHLNI